MNILAGKKTYILAAAGAAVFFVQLMGWWTPPAEVWQLLGVGGVVTMRAGIKKAER